VFCHANVAASVTAYSDFNLAGATQYFYRLRAYRQGDDFYTVYSNIAHIFTDQCPFKSFLPMVSLSFP
jgi:hypothetical protein